ncbi:hypothetical protein ACIBCH_29875 [Amycolatopsis thailandensis]
MRDPGEPEQRAPDPRGIERVGDGHAPDAGLGGEQPEPLRRLSGQHEMVA